MNNVVITISDFIQLHPMAAYCTLAGVLLAMGSCLMLSNVVHTEPQTNQCLPAIIAAYDIGTLRDYSTERLEESQRLAEFHLRTLRYRQDDESIRLRKKLQAVSDRINQLLSLRHYGLDGMTRVRNY